MNDDRLLGGHLGTPVTKPVERELDKPRLELERLEAIELTAIFNSRSA